MTQYEDLDTSYDRKLENRVATLERHIVRIHDDMFRDSRNITDKVDAPIKALQGYRGEQMQAMRADAVSVGELLEQVRVLSAHVAALQKKAGE